MSDTLVTYHSKNSRPEHQWLGFIHLADKRVNIQFLGETEDAVKAKMRAFYTAEIKDVREAARVARAEQQARTAAKLAARKEAA